MVWHSLLQWAMFWQNSPPRHICLGWPYTAWLIVSLWYIRGLVFCDCGFHSVCPLIDKDKRLVEASTGCRGIWVLFCLGRVMLSKSLIQFLLMGRAVFSPGFMAWGKYVLGAIVVMVTSFKRIYARTFFFFSFIFIRWRLITSQHFS